MSMFRSGVAPAVVTAILLWVPSVRAQCTKDVECKGDRVCEGGKCVNPSDLPAADTATPGRCTADSQCKFNRICEGGVCVSPPEAGTAPTQAPTAPPPGQPTAPPVQPVGPAPQPAPAANHAQAETPIPARDIELQDLQARRRAGRALLITGIVAVVVGGAAQAGWALEECWTTGTNISGYNEECELTTLGSSLVVTGFVLLALGTTSIIIGGIQLKKAREGTGDLSSARLSISPLLDPTARAQGLSFTLSF